VKLICRFIFLIALLFSGIALADDTLLQDKSASQQLLSLLKNIKSLQATFVQESYDAKNTLLQKQNGNFKVTEKGEFVWNIQAPYEQKIISDGKTIKIFDPDLEQLTIKPIDKKTQVIPLLLFSGDSEALTKQYNVSSSSADVYTLSAQNKNSLFDNLQISFKEGKPDSLTIIDSMKQKTLVHFSQVDINQTINASSFLFEAPKGVDVIDERKIDEH